jgi:hypothetical protein
MGASDSHLKLVQSPSTTASGSSYASKKDSRGSSMLVSAVNWLMDDGSAKRHDQTTQVVIDSKKVWSAIQSNQSLYLHVHVSQEVHASLCSGIALIGCGQGVDAGSQSPRTLHGFVNLVKFAPHSAREKRWLLDDFKASSAAGVSGNPLAASTRLLTAS